jgi:hypothetical protein
VADHAYDLGFGGQPAVFAGVSLARLGTDDSHFGALFEQAHVHDPELQVLETRTDQESDLLVWQAYDAGSFLQSTYLVDVCEDRGDVPMIFLGFMRATPGPDVRAAPGIRRDLPARAPGS